MSDDLSEQLYRTKNATKDVDFETPGYITEAPTFENGKIVFTGTTPNGETSWSHIFENPDEWSYKWDIVRLIESDAVDWSIASLSDTSIVGEPVPLRKRSDGVYKIDVPETTAGVPTRAKDTTSELLSRTKEKGILNTTLIAVWILTLISIIIGIFVVIV